MGSGKHHQSKKKHSQSAMCVDCGRLFWPDHAKTVRCKRCLKRLVEKGGK